MQRLRLWQLALGCSFFGSIALYFLLPSDYAPSQIFRIAPDDQSSEFYRWQSPTEFPTIQDGEVANVNLPEICQYFPKHKLRKIQPVLKTGHGVLDRVRSSLSSTSACLDNLLIFSDLDEELDGFQLIDVIADIPDELLLSEEAFNQTLPYRELKALQANGTLNDATMSKVQGWESDKFKFLPSILRAWRMAPEKSWYVFYEGDTYIVWDTVFRVLDHFDPDEAHYFGSPSPGREETWFAYGGAGYILSREAMWQLVKDDWDRRADDWRGSSELIEKYWDVLLHDCCGDSITGWALHERGVNVEGLWPMFNPHPLQGIPFSDSYWCQPVISMHKSFHKEQTDLWRWEWEARMMNPWRPILYANIANDFFDMSSFTTVRENWDNGEWGAYDPSPEDPNEPHTSSESCAKACRDDSRCHQWTYHLKRCKFVDVIRVGRPREPGVEKDFAEETWTLDEQRYTAGWDTPGVRTWMNDRTCEEVQWVKPSTERIF